MRKVAGLVLSVVVGSSAILAACGGEAGQSQGAQTPVGPSPSSSGSVAGTPTEPPPSKPPPGPAAPMGTVTKSVLAADLTKMGLDPKNLPPLDKMEPTKLRQVMKTFSKALGVSCTGCHRENDFHAPTPNKKVAAKMWDNFVRGFTMDDGSPVYCDSCHDGRKEMLDRHDLKALGKWMDANFVAKLKRVDGKDHGCDTCHGDPFEGKFLAQWTK